MPHVLSAEMTPEEEDREMYSYGKLSYEELNDKYADRPRNTNRTLPFHNLYKDLFDPLMENKNSKAKKGRTNKLSPQAMRRQVIERFISRWRNMVGNDFLPAMKLILPEKDRDRAMYGLKERAIAKLLIKLVSIDSKSDDAISLIDWKVPGKNGKTAGDFPERCYQVLSKRPSRKDPGTMTVGEVNILLDRLAMSQKDEDQLPILQQFYNRMNAEEMTWLIRIILRQMKLGASEKTILDIFHPEAESVFNISSSLRRVCWELSDPTKVTDEKYAIEIMQCFKPQLAQFQSHSFHVMLRRMKCEDKPFWIEEKLDGERIQLHMEQDDSIPGGARFAFYSRKGKDYTYLYGEGYEDESSALTQHMKGVFREGVTSIILDGEMITWDPISCQIVAFGTLKSAANSEKENPFGETGHRPVFRVFDCLYLNGTVLTQQRLENRRKILGQALTNKKHRIEIHEYQRATSISEIDPALRKVYDEGGEGLVLKNPESVYQLNARIDDWMKVKPEYMTGFGESLDCIIIGGYYGSGRRGGDFSSFMCGLLVSQNYRDSHPGTHPEKCVSFFKVGGGFRASDYSEIRERLGGKWKVWDPKNPPEEYIFLGAGRKQLLEKPDEWIRPSDSLVVEVKAASVGTTSSFGAEKTLRFPRFKRFRFDKTWETALSCDEFDRIKKESDDTVKDTEFNIAPKRRATKRLKRKLTIAGNTKIVTTPYAGSKTNLFEGLTFFVITDMLRPEKKSRADIKQMIKANGGALIESSTKKATREKVICVGEKNVSEVAGLIKQGMTNIVRPVWVLEAIKQDYLLPFEPRHMYHITEDARPGIEENVDVYGDSYARDLSLDELTTLLNDMIYPKNSEFSPQQFLNELEERGRGDLLGDLKACMFRGCVVRFHVDESLDTRILMHKFQFAGGQIALDDDVDGITHFVVAGGDGETAKRLRMKVAGLVGRKLPHILSLEWLADSWREGTLLDEESYAHF